MGSVGSGASVYYVDLITNFYLKWQNLSEKLGEKVFCTYLTYQSVNLNYVHSTAEIGKPKSLKNPDN